MSDWMNSRVFFYLSRAGRVALLAALIYSYLIHFPELTVLTGFLLLSLAPFLLKKRLNNFYDFLYMIFILFNTSSFIWDGYGMVSYYDDIVHFLTPLLLVILSAQFFLRYFKKSQRQSFVFFLSLTAFGVLLGVGWEILEWISEQTFLPYTVMFGLADTMSDLIWDLIGSATGALIYVAYLSRIRIAVKGEEKI